MASTATVDAAPQHLRALEHANKVRLARAELKRKIAEDRITVAEVIASCPWQVESMPISDLLMSQRRWGRARCRRLLVSLGIPENKPISTFTERQRSALVAVLSARTGKPRPEGGASQPFDRVEVRGSHSTGRTAMVASL
jgi:hypothetical protein